MSHRNKQFYAKLIVFISILIVGIILIVWVDTPENFGHTGHGYLTMIVGIFIFLGVLILIHGIIVLQRPERQKEKDPEKVKRSRFIIIVVFIILIINIRYITNIF